MKLSVILPILNEEHVIEQTLNSLMHTLKIFCSDIEILAVNDGSTDKTAAILNKLAKKNVQIKPIIHEKNRGYGAALRSGIQHSSHEWIFFTDADSQFDVKELSRFLPYSNNFDFIVGWRKNRADSHKRKFISSAYNRFTRLLFGLPLQDVDCAFKLMRKSSVSQIEIKSDSFFVSVELMVKALRKKMRIKELSVSHYPRIKGESKVTFGRILHTIRDLLSLKLKGL